MTASATTFALQPRGDRGGTPEGMTDDIRWQQRFSNYQKALTQLETFAEPLPSTSANSKG